MHETYTLISGPEGRIGCKTLYVMLFYYYVI